SLAPAIRTTFDEFKRQHAIRSEPLRQAHVEGIAERAIDALLNRRSRSPRHRIACELLATIPWTLANGVTKQLSPSLVDKTLSTLRKHVGKAYFNYLGEGRLRVVTGRLVLGPSARPTR